MKHVLPWFRIPMTPGTLQPPSKWDLHSWVRHSSSPLSNLDLFLEFEEIWWTTLLKKLFTESVFTIRLLDFVGSDSIVGDSSMMFSLSGPPQTAISALLCLYFFPFLIATNGFRDNVSDLFRLLFLWFLTRTLLLAWPGNVDDFSPTFLSQSAAEIESTCLSNMLGPSSIS